MVTCYIYTDTEHVHPHQVTIRTYLIHCRHVRWCFQHQPSHDVHVASRSSAMERSPAILAIENVTCYIYTDTEQTHPHQVIIRTYPIHCRHVRRCLPHQASHDIHVTSPGSVVEGSPAILTIENVTCYIYTDTDQVHPHQVTIRTYLIHCRHVHWCFQHQTSHDVHVTSRSSAMEGSHAILTIENVTCYIYIDTEQTHLHQVVTGLTSSTAFVAIWRGNIPNYFTIWHFIGYIYQINIFYVDIWSSSLCAIKGLFDN